MLLFKCLFDFLFWRALSARSSKRNENSVSVSIGSIKKAALLSFCSLLFNGMRVVLVRYDTLLDKYGEDPISFKLLLPSMV